jgi:ubiquinone/menaquinone biosynthesis C-methylase UbiE
MNEIEMQKEYYARTAASYDGMHALPTGEEEHDIALSSLIGLSAYYGINSFLDVGCGTGRSLDELHKRRPDATVMGVEPVTALREVAYSKGIPRASVVEGDATNLKFEDNAFDCVSAFAILHHIRNPTAAIREMLRVAKKAVFISDLNNFGCGSFPQRLVSQTLNALGLWKAFQFVVTRGKGYKYDEGDGVHYSYSLYNDYKWLARCCRNVHVINTKGAGINPYRTCSHVALFAVKH